MSETNVGHLTNELYKGLLSEPILIYRGDLIFWMKSLLTNVSFALSPYSLADFLLMGRRCPFCMEGRRFGKSRAGANFNSPRLLRKWRKE